MKFILIYGPPATGKLTVAKELQNITNYKLLHNHLIVDLIEAIDVERTPDYFKLEKKLFTEVLNFAIKRHVNVISTFLYAYGVDDPFMNFLASTIKKSGGEIYFIQLTCSKEKLMERVTNPSRKKFGKIKDPTKLQWLLEKYDLETPFVDTNYTIDNSNKSPSEVAQEIKSHINY